MSKKIIDNNFLKTSTHTYMYIYTHTVNSAPVNLYYIYILSICIIHNNTYIVRTTNDQKVFQHGSDEQSSQLIQVVGMDTINKCSLANKFGNGQYQ